MTMIDPAWKASLPVLAALALVAGCRREPKCFGELSSEEMFRLQERMQEGTDPCPELLTPSVELTTGGGLRLGDVVLGRYEGVPPGGRKIAALHAELRTRRDTWKQLHPREEFKPEPTLRISPNADTEVAESVLRTTAYAGYPVMQVESGGVTLKLGWAVPGPPSDEGKGPAVLHVEQSERGSYRLRVERSGQAVGHPGELGRVDDIPGWIASYCATSGAPCADVVRLDVRGPFGGTMALLRDILRVPALAQRPPWVRLGAAEP